MKAAQARTCIHCGYDQAAATEDRERGLTPSVKTMLLVDGHWCDSFGQWCIWWGGGFIRGGHGPAPGLYWVCEQCHAPTEAVQKVAKGYGH